jgi:hypothetical protein
MLQCVETEIREMRGLFVPVDPKDATFIVETVRAVGAIEGFDLFGRESIEGTA